MPQPQLRYVSDILAVAVNTNECSAHPSHRHYPPISKDSDVFHLATRMQIYRDWIIYIVPVMTQDIFGTWTNSVRMII